MIHRVKAIALDYRGYGVVKDLGKVGFIKGLLPGEEANIKITTEKKKYFEGVIIELINKSKYRNETNDDYDNNSLSHLDNQKQLTFQVDITLETFLRNGFNDFKANPIIYDENFYNYRNKALFHVINSPFIQLGGFRDGTKSFVEIDELILADELINDILKVLKKYYQENRVYFHDLKSIMIRSNSTEVMVIFITNTTTKIPELLYRPLLNDNRVISIYQNYQDIAHQNLGNQNIFHLKNEFITDKIGPLKFVIYPNSFFQVNHNVTKLAYDYIKTLLKSDDVVIDAYAGMSSIGQYISSKVKQVYSIENDFDSIKSANESIKLNEIKNVEIVAGDFNKEFKNYRRIANTVIVDPPRSGLITTTVESLNNSKIEKIIYMSCNLKTLVRDLKLLTNYTVIEVTPVKMFYQTVEIETIVYLEKNNEN